MKVGSIRSRLVRVIVPAAATLLIATAGHAQQQAIAADEFHAGDRIALTVEGIGQGTAQGSTIISDTVVVREGQILRFPSVGDVSLAGVRRPDLQKYLTQQFSKFLRDPVVHATPLVRIAVLGQVGRPGFYSLPSDIPLSDVVMRAGGPTGESDLNKTVVKRGTTTVIDKGQISQALTSGQTLDDLKVAPGDELVVGEKSHFGFGTILQVAGLAVSVLGLYFAFHRR